MHILSRLTLRDKFLVSFLGLAVVLTSMLTLLASKVNDILPELTLTQARRYEAQLLLRDLRESILISQVPNDVQTLMQGKIDALEKLKNYEDHLSITASQGAYEALVTEDRGELVYQEEEQVNSIRKTLQAAVQTESGAIVTAALQDKLSQVVDQAKELERINDEAIIALNQAEKTTRRFVLTFFLLSLAILLLGITIFAQLLSVWITHPLRTLQHAAMKIASGDLTEQKLDLSAHDEFGSVMHSFDYMRRKVLESLDDVRAFARRDELLIDSIVDIIIAVDDEERIILFNSAAEQLTGRSRLGAIHKRFDELITFEDASNQLKQADVIAKVIQTGQAQSFPRPIILKGVKSSTSIPVTISVAPFMETEGKRGAVIVLRNVSESVELDRLRDEFVSIASHQLRTPLTAIRWLLESLIKGELETKFALDQKHHDALAQAYDRTLSMSELVSSLLALSRVDAQKVKAKFQPVKLDDMFAKLQLSFDAVAQRKNIRVNIRNDIKNAISTDEVILSEIVSNLISNAIKYTRDGGTVEAVATAQGGKIEIAVKDDGIGIPPEQQPSIFQKFFRAKNASLFTPEGTGIGLYMVRSFVELLGGTVSFLSKEGAGTTFSLHLPLRSIDG